MSRCNKRRQAIFALISKIALNHGYFQKVKIMEHHPARSHGSTCPVQKSYDTIRFVDLNFIMDWSKFFGEGIDKRTQLGVKGPHTNHCFIFEAREHKEQGAQIRQVITSCKRFMSPSGKDVPMILPDLSSDHWKEYKKVSTKTIEYDPYSCEKEIGEVLNERVQSTSSEYTLLGLRIFKISNNENYIFNILQRPLEVQNLQIAPFEKSVKAHMVYQYCDHVRKNIGRYSEDEKNQVLEFMQTNFPPKLVDISKGFASDASINFVVSKKGNPFLVIQFI